MSDNNSSENTPLRAVRDTLNRPPQKESKLFKFFAFLSLTDYQVLKECGKYDHTLVYAMVFRQIVTFAFTCLLFSYGVSMFLDLYAAIIIGVIFALTLFFLDQAIIGSDWALKNPFKGGLPIRSLFGLIPRIVYSLIIAIGLATLAEISLQANAIDEQIQKESNEKNQEYFAKLEKYEQELETGIGVDRKKVEDIQAEIVQLSEQKSRYELSVRSNDTETLGNTLTVKQENLAELQRTQQVLIAEIASINKRLATSREEYSYWFNEALLERTGKDGRAPTEGPKYRRAVSTYTDIKEQIGILEGSLADAKDKLTALKPDIDTATEELNLVQKERNELILSETNYAQNGENIGRLNDDLLAAKATLNRAIDDKQKKMDEYRTKLEKDGLFYEVKTGMLRRYLALKSIHNDPEVGEAASMFSLLLKIFFIAIELMPVIVKLFFSPFSFYSLRMYRKMQIALLEEEELLEAAKAERKMARERRIRETGELDAVNAV
ncbi:DUF4407 domain-containing protein [Pleionea sp. CnH1-48]|uniref:DUF4407 domain-containing protein n=1 Tax=Pleionea sp. CnH1-48 TaxID=2954494 RepID=UPI00209780A8|nr:DUF4407 domain-containing protein [Pleionea sp. CnH1-48]MCO7225590.1 DUF4407 domain-containing protein [Pleionea sp. CnH1-48]